MLRTVVAGSDINLAIDGSEREIAGFLTDAMREATTGLVADLRDQVRAAALGNRLANTWRGKTYPETGHSLSPAGYVWSNAPAIVTAFSGATIKPHGGKRYLWIPTANVPRALGGSRGSSKRADPTEVERQFNQDLIVLKGKGRTRLAFVNAIEAKNKKGFRRATAVRLAQARQVKRILMFVLVPAVTVRRRLDIDAAANFWASRFPALLEQNWR